MTNDDILWWKGAAIYQIYPRSFQDSSGRRGGKGVGDGVGDLPGITSRLDYVAGLGVDGIWLSPFFTSPMADYGYDVADYRDVDPVFGTLADFDTLLTRAHDLGLKVIIDQVYSHTSDAHAWFAESRQSHDNPRADWYVWADAREDGTAPSNWLSFFGGPAWTWDSRRRQYYLHNFLSAQPDLNFHNPDVQDAVLDVARFWLDRGVDGFRLDVANYFFHDERLRDNPPSGATDGERPYTFQRHLYNRSRPETPAFLERLREVLDSYDARMSVAEIASGSNLARSVEYTRGSQRLHTAYNFHFLECDNPSPAFVRDAVEAWNGVDAWPSWSLSNHDITRTVTRWSGGKSSPERARFLLALILCLRGTIFLYEGEELGLPQADVPFEKLRDPEAIRFWPNNQGRDGCRTPMPWEAKAEYVGFSDAEPWLPVEDAHRELAVDAQERSNDSTLHYARTLLKTRADMPSLRMGDIAFRDDVPESVLAFERTHENERVLCLFNFSVDAEVELALEASATLRPRPELCLALTLDGNRVTLGPNGCLIAYISSKD